jgi:hypothetical protein
VLLLLPPLALFLLRKVPLSQNFWPRRIALNGLKLKQPPLPLLLLLPPLALFLLRKVPLSQNCWLKRIALNDLKPKQPPPPPLAHSCPAKRHLQSLAKSL